MRLRKLGPDDSRDARRVVRRFHGSVVSSEHLASLLADPANVLVVAEHDGELAGFAWAHWLGRLRVERRHLFVYEIEVAEGHRRRGIGRRLMTSLLAEARAERADAFVLTNRSNPGAVRFYTELGGTVKNGDDLLFVFRDGRKNVADPAADDDPATGGDDRQDPWTMRSRPDD